MKIQRQLKSHGAWIGKWTFILAATGSAVGLGNIWGFPYKAGTNGGGAFVLIYLGCILIIGIPIMISEIILGRRAGNSPINAMRCVALESNRSSSWQIVGWSGIYGPPGMDPAVAKKIRDALQLVKKDKAWNKFTKALGSVPHILDEAETKKFVDDQFTAFNTLVSDLGMKIE